MIIVYDKLIRIGAWRLPEGGKADSQSPGNLHPNAEQGGVGGGDKQGESRPPSPCPPMRDFTSLANSQVFPRKNCGIIFGSW